MKNSIKRITNKIKQQTIEIIIGSMPYGNQKQEWITKAKKYNDILQNNGSNKVIMYLVINTPYKDRKNFIKKSKNQNESAFFEII